MNQFDWIEFYHEFAIKLLYFKDNRQELISKVKKVYSKIEINLPTLEKDNDIVDIDPFTVFGLFNKSSLKEVNRIKIISAMATEFEVHAKIPNSFASIPVLNNQNAIFYSFVDLRGSSDIDDLWGLFEYALMYAKQPIQENRELISKYFDLVINKKGNANSKTTMALYWIAPDVYLNLDDRNTWFIYESGKLPNDLVNSLPKIKNKVAASIYFEIVEKLHQYVSSSESAFDNFMSLSHKAWETSMDEGMTKQQDSSISNSFLRWMNPIVEALKELGGSGTPQLVREQIIVDESLSEEEVNEVRGKNKVNKFINEVDFAKYYLVQYGLLSNHVRGIWELTENGTTVEMTDELALEIKKYVTNQQKNRGNVGNALADEDVDSLHYWLYSPGDSSNVWETLSSNNLMALSWPHLGNLELFESKSAIASTLKEQTNTTKSFKNTSHALWQFVHDLKIGDIVFVVMGRNQVVGRGIVTSDYYYDDKMSNDYPNIRNVQWTHLGYWEHPGLASLKIFTDITPYTDYVQKLNELFEVDSIEEGIERLKHPYTEADFLDEVYFDKIDYKILTDLLKRKRNVILQGAPGVGKTFIAKRLAYSIMGLKDRERVMMVQFHQSYSYEDLIEGFRPTENGFEIKKGSLYNFCRKAQDDLENEYFFIIDEINRGNISKIFGELFMLIESDKRGNELQLLYSDEKFSIPKNVYLIGMMNTADRSLAMMDYALRRRFAFYEIKPGFKSNGFKTYQEMLNNDKFDHLINCIQGLNEDIATDESLGEGFCIGHSYVCGLEHVDDQLLSNIVEYELIPLLKEYWYDEPSKVTNWTNNLRASIK